MEDTALLLKTENRLRTQAETRRIHIRLCYNRELGDWSLQIDDKWHRHVTSDVVEALVDGTLMEAKMSLEEGFAPAENTCQRLTLQ